MPDQSIPKPAAAFRGSNQDSVGNLEAQAEKWIPPNLLIEPVAGVALYANRLINPVTGVAVTAAEIGSGGGGGGTTDAGALTGTLAPARIADGSLSIAKTIGLQTALAGALTGTIAPARIADGSLSIAKTIGLQTALDGKAEKFVPVYASLDIPNYSGRNTTTHPDVVFIDTDGGWNGYKYWMAHTPYPDVTPLEYPAVCASNDGINWVTPTGAANIIWHLTTNSDANTYQHFADIEIIHTAEDKMRVYWIASNDSAPKRHGLLCLESSNGIDWNKLTTDGFVLEVSGHLLGSPAILQLPDESWVMFSTVTADGGGLTYNKRTSADGITWSGPTVCTMPVGWNGWHTNVVLKDGRYHMLCQQRFSPTRSSAFLSYIWSDDGLAWSGDPLSAINREFSLEPKQFGGGGIYRSCMIPREDGLWDLWFTSILSVGVGDGDVSGDNVASPGWNYDERINLAKGVDLSKVNKWDWRPAPKRVQRLPEPSADLNHKRFDSYMPLFAAKGWQWEFETGYSGIPAGESVRVTLGTKKSLLPASTAIFRGMGKLEISGQFDLNVCEAAIFISGNAAGGVKTLAQTTAGKYSWTGLNEFFIRTQIMVAGEAWSVTPVEGDTITFHNSSTDALEITAKIHRVVATTTYLNIYIKEPNGTVAIATGKKIKINGAWLTYGVAETVQLLNTMPYPAQPGGVMVFYHTYDGGADGGFVEVWNNKTTSWHGDIKFKSFR